MANELQERPDDRMPVSTPAVVAGVLDWETDELPTEDELGVEDDKPVESTRHRDQSDLMRHLLNRILGHREDVCIAGDLGLFYQHPHPPVVPDVMVVFGVEKRDRKAYLVWKEGKGPDWVLELLSESNAAKDREINYEIYEQRIRVPEYVWFNPDDPTELRGFRLAGDEYEEMTPDEHGRLWSKVLGHSLGVHEGWLRLYDADGDLVLTGDERAQQEQVAREATEAEAAQERAAREAAEAEAAQERAAREAAEAEAAQERAAREAAEAEAARLREELARLKA
jgi:Uma2 family endonuclease